MDIHPPELAPGGVLIYKVSLRPSVFFTGAAAFLGIILR